MNEVEALNERRLSLRCLVASLGLSVVKEPDIKRRGLSWSGDQAISVKYVKREPLDSEFNEYDADGS